MAPRLADVSRLPHRRGRSLLTAAMAVAVQVAAPAAGLGQSGAPPPTPEAGEPPLRAGGGVGAYSLLGDDFPDIGAGPGLAVSLRGRLSSGVSLGAGLQHSWHSAPRLASSFRLLSLHVEPRFRLPPPARLGSFRPYVGLRAGYARWEAHESSGELDAQVAARGLQVGAVAGIAVPLASGVELELSAEAGYLTFGDARVDARFAREPPVRDRGVPGSGTDGLLLGLRGALLLPLPWP